MVVEGQILKVRRATDTYMYYHGIKIYNHNKLKTFLQQTAQLLQLAGNKYSWGLSDVGFLVVKMYIKLRIVCRRRLRVKVV